MDITCGKKAYLQMYINGRWVSALMDSGCELTILPAWLVRREQLQQTSQKALAANGSGIPLTGTAKVEATIGGDQFVIEGLVSDTVTEPMIGIEWLEANDAYWMFRRGAIRLRGQVYRLSDRQQRNVWVQRTALVRSTVVSKLGVIDEQSEEEEEITTQAATVPKEQEEKDCWTDEEAVPSSKKEATESDSETKPVSDWWAHVCLRDAQQTDESVSLVYKALEESSTPPEEVRIYEWPPVARILWHNWRRLKIRDGILHYKWEAEDGTGTSWPVVTPEKYRHGEFWSRHVDWYGRHRSCEEVYELMERHVYWPRWQIDVQVWTRACPQCKGGRSRHRKPPKPPDLPKVERKTAMTQTLCVWRSTVETIEEYPLLANGRVPTMYFRSRTFACWKLPAAVGPPSAIATLEPDERRLRDRGRMKKPARFRE
jgi:predicted aspartyl protease